MMKSYEYRAFTYSADIYCAGCLPGYAEKIGDPPHPIFADSEWDYYPTCCICGAVHDYVSLTNDGQREQWRAELPAEWQKETQNGGDLPAWAWPGGYPVYYLTADGSTICPACANKIDTSDAPIARDINWEDGELYCDDCSERIESAYAEPENDNP